MRRAASGHASDYWAALGMRLSQVEGKNWCSEADSVPFRGQTQIDIKAI